MFFSPHAREVRENNEEEKKNTPGLGRKNYDVDRGTRSDGAEGLPPINAAQPTPWMLQHGTSGRSGRTAPR